MTLFQILAVLFALWMMYEVFIHSKKKIFTQFELAAWFSLWCFFIVIAVFPELLLGIAHKLFFSRVFDLLVVGTLMVLSILIFLSYFSHKENTLKLNRLITELALNDGKQQLTDKKVSKK